MWMVGPWILHRHGKGYYIAIGSRDKPPNGYSKRRFRLLSPEKKPVTLVADGKGNPITYPTTEGASEFITTNS